MIAIGCDPAGYTLAQQVMQHLEERGDEYRFFGTFDTVHANYPYFGQKVGEVVGSGAFEKGIVLCGSGIGISIAANKCPGVRAALCLDAYTAAESRRTFDANILAAGGRVVAAERFFDVVDAFLDTPFDPANDEVLDAMLASENKYLK